MKPILLKLDEKQFFKHANLKQRIEILRREAIDWEEYFEVLRKNWESTR